MMALLTSSPATVSVTSFPYSLPGSGQALSIGTNFAEDVRPPSHSAPEWNYALFFFYGGGTYVEDYSAGGAYVIAGSGGHAVPPNFGGCVFDFADATWKRIDNANGMPWINRDLNAPGYSGEINGFGEINWPGVSAGIPAPAHLYGNVLPVAANNGGGSRGSALILQSLAAGYSSATGSAFAHRFDLATGLWTRLSTNIPGYSQFRSTCYDPVTNRYYGVRFEINESSLLDYLDGADWTWKTVSIGGSAGDGNNKSAFIDETRRLLIMQTSTGRLRAINLNNPSAGVMTLRTVGNLPGDNQSQWHRYPADGCWYTYEGWGSNIIHKIQPPSGNPLTETWTASTVSIGGASLPAQGAQAKEGAVHNTRFFYVRPIGCFAWIAGERNPVVILRP
jgi:hypothetical protein